MAEKGSEMQSKAAREELNRTFIEFKEKLETDPYQPGITHPNLCGDDLQDIVDDVLFVRDFREMTVKIVKEDNGVYLSMEVTERKK